MKTQQAPLTVVGNALVELTHANKRLQRLRESFLSITVGAIGDNETSHILFTVFDRYCNLLADSLERLRRVENHLRSNYFPRKSFFDRFFEKTRHRQPHNLQVPIGVLEGVHVELGDETRNLIEWLTPIMGEIGGLFSVRLTTTFTDILKVVSSLEKTKGLLIEAEVISNTKSSSLPEQTWDFVQNEELRLLLSRDYQELGLLVAIGARKSALVLCGSIIEALLVATLKQNEAAALDSYSALSTRSRSSSRISNIPPIEDWKLWELISVAGEMGELDSDTKRQADILRDYRNLIHPLVEIRRGTQLDEELVQAQLILLTRVLRSLSH